MNRRSSLGFSLIELLLVMTIMALIMGLLIPSISALLTANNLTRAGQTVVDQVSLARQYASSQSSAVEVRLIRLPDRSADGFHALQVWGAMTDGTTVPMDRLQRLPEGMAIATAQDKSPFFKLLTNAAAMPSNGAAGGATYVSFRIRPGGTVVPQSTNKVELCLSIVPERQTNSANFVTLQINPDTATVAAFRPQ